MSARNLRVEHASLLCLIEVFRGLCLVGTKE